MCQEKAKSETTQIENEPLPEESPQSRPAATDKEPPTSSSLNPKIVTVWMIENAITLGTLLIAVSAGAIALGSYTNAPKLLLLLVWLVVLTIFLSRLFWFPKREFQRWSYQLDDQTLELRYGVIWQKTVAIPMSRLQHVDLQRGPLDRHYKLSSLEVHTAGTRNASHQIPGLEPDRAVALRDELVIAAKIELQ